MRNLLLLAATLAALLLPVELADARGGRSGRTGRSGYSGRTGTGSVGGGTTRRRQDKKTLQRLRERARFEERDALLRDVRRDAV